MTLNGAAAKGPFLIGSTVTVTPVSAAGNPSGNTFPTQTDDSLGNFTVELDYQGPVKLEAVGQWYNELSGQTETSPLTLRGFAEITTSGSQHAYINPITHITHSRVKKLMGDGASLSDASAQAEAELRTQFRLGETGFDPAAAATDLNLLGGDTDQAAYVFAMGAVSLLGATAANGLTAQNFLNSAESSFTTSGVISGSLVAAFDKAHQFVEPDQAMRDLAAYFEQQAFVGVVPNINRVLDTDGDGVANLDDTCVMLDNPAQDPMRGICAYQKLPLPSDPPGSISYGGVIPLHGDVDGDGDEDILRVTLPTTSVYENDGSGTFTRTSVALSTALGLPNGPPDVMIESAALGEVDGDGQVDLVLSLREQGPPGYTPVSVRLLPGDGSGNFSAPSTIWDGTFGGACVVDGDPCTQGVTNCCSGSCEQMMPGVYECMPSPGGSEPGAITQLQLVDLNDDAMLDIVGAMPVENNGGLGDNPYNGTIAAVLLNPGAGGWSEPELHQVSAAPSEGVKIYGLSIGNFTGDAYPDILAIAADPDGFMPNPAASGVYLLTNDGSGGFTVSGPLATLGDDCTTSITTGDFDEDTNLDLALLDQNATQLTVAFGNGDGTFSAPLDVPVGQEPSLTPGGSGGSGSCPTLNSLGDSGLGMGHVLYAAHYTGSSHWDIAAGRSIFVSDGRNDPTQEFVRFAGYGSNGVGPADGNLPLPANADYNADGTTDVWMDYPSGIVLVNPPGYRSW